MEGVGQLWHFIRLEARQMTSDVLSPSGTEI